MTARVEGVLDAGRSRAVGWVAALSASRRPRYLLTLGALVALYAGAAEVSYSLDFAGPVASIVWLPVGVGIAFLYLGGLELFPGVLVGDLLVNEYSTLPIPSALGQSTGNVLEVVVAVVLLRRLVRRGSPLDSVTGVACLLLALAAGTALSATIGTISNWLGGVVASDAVALTWRTWWLGDFAGALVVVPLVLAWWKPPGPAPTLRRLTEGAALLVSVVVLSDVSSGTTQPIVYVVFPALIWAALRFGRRGATLAVAITTIITIWNTTHYVGPFSDHTLGRSVYETQLFTGVAAITTLALAAMVSERERFTRDLTSSRSRIVEAAQVERRRLERDLHDGAQQRLVRLAVDLHEAATTAQQNPGRTEALLGKVEEQLILALEDLRDLAHGIHPAVLTDLGLGGAMAGIALRSNIPVTIVQLPGVRLDETAETTAYYVIAEAVTNAQKHAGATALRVSAVADERTLRIKVSDDGVGGAAARGSGLQGLRDRVESIGGTFEVASPAGGGTRVSATIPLAGSRRPASPS